MHKKRKQAYIKILHEEGCAIREISRKLKVSRNRVRRVIREELQGESKSREEKVDLELLREIFSRCNGNAVRVWEILESEHDQKLGYSTVTRLLREARLREDKKRVGQHPFGPGEEMQHDTSPHRLRLGEKQITAQCAALQLAYSRYCYIQYFANWTRFEARWFLSEALAFLGGSAGRCVIDNSSVILARGSGSDAEMAPDMTMFSEIYGFTFQAHRIAHPQRKGVVERGFSYAENNFLAGRSFRDWTDLNEQAKAWCEAINNKEKRALGMSPRAAYLMERRYLKVLPKHPPPIYQPLARVVDTRAYLTVDTNRYSAPEHLIGKQVEVLKYPDRLEVYFKDRMVAQHPRLLEKQRGQITDPSHHKPLAYERHRSGPCASEQMLRGKDPILDDYLTQFKRRLPGRGVAKFRRLLNLMRTYPWEAFLAAIHQAHPYGLYDLTRLEQIILSRVAGDFFQLQLEGDEPCL